MHKLQGIPVSPGVAIGEAFVMGTEGFRIPRRFVSRDAVEDELERFDKALQAALDEVAANRDAVARELGAEYAAIFEAHRQMLSDPRLRGQVQQLIRQDHHSPEYAVSRTLREYAKVFERLRNNYLAQRAGDIYDLEKRLLRHLLGQRREEISHLTSPVLVLAHNLTPSETAGLDRRFVKGFATEAGGPGSHTAIVAAGMEIPAVVGAGPFLTEVSGGDLVIIDGNTGLVILDPDEETLARYRQEEEAVRTRAADLQRLRDLPAVTLDGTRIELLGTIEFPHEVQQCTQHGADGVGLYRTEFLYLGVQSEPTEEDHYRAYAQVVQAMAPRPVIIRTLDLGADKVPHLPRSEEEHNPFLGLRSLRLSLKNLDMFRTQLRAVLRASVLGDVRLMFPLVATLRELRQAKMVLADVMEDLSEAGVPFNEKLPVGMMVEVPSAVMMIQEFVREVDFLSIGANDLTQYTLAVDRSNKDVVELYNSCDPGVLRLIRIAADAGRAAGLPVYLCGQMGARPAHALLLWGMGLRHLSVTPSAIPELKRLCRSVTIAQCEAIAARALALDDARDTETLLKEELRKLQLK
jgi:phosphotransferase system enzyme I (PtsI)